jgi:hypothetical protein
LGGNSQRGNKESKLEGHFESEIQIESTFYVLVPVARLEPFILGL